MYNSILVIISIILIYMASYTSFDLFQLVKASEKNSRFLFLASTFSLGFGFWVMSFVALMADNIYATSSYDIPIATLSMLIGICFAGMAFYSMLDKENNKHRIYVSSLFFSFSMLAVFILGLYSIGNSVQAENMPALFFSFLLLFSGFSFSVKLSFYPAKKTRIAKGIVRPLCSFIITGVCFLSHFILLHSMTPIEYEPSHYDDSFIVYVVLFITILILGGLIGTSTLIREKLAVNDINVRDMQYALDESSIVAFTDKNGMITYVNDKFVEISKYSRSELIGQNHRIINSGYHSSEFFKQLWKTISSGNIWKGEIRNKAKDGSFYWVDTVIVPFVNKKGEPYQYVSIRRDITDQKQDQIKMQEMVQEVSDIKFALDQSSIIAFTDKQGVITNVNDKFCRISGYSEEELIGQTHRIVNSGYHSAAFFQELWHSIANGEVWKGEIRNKAKNGSYYWVDTTIIPFLDSQNKPYKYLAIRNDITERKRTEEILHRQDKLAAVGQLAAGIAHEIRNPLTSIKGYTEFLSMDETETDRQELFSIVLEEIERVNSIVEEFMLLSKPTSASLEKKEIIPIIANVLSILDYQLRKSKVQVDFTFDDSEARLECDENKLKQVFLNFIKNAVEAMPSGGSLKIAVKTTAKSIDVLLQDTGIGMDKDQLQKLGEPFFTTKKEGTGLGLLVSFKIIENFKGKVYIESEKNKGTSFHITFPKAGNDLG
ncbi:MULTISPECIES: PAS domain S-box protein [unclassified Niallia]|uniref:PAS domain S-box protein n=1 Tax=unclassified Niallia TaxID=2837522 RepID=UPI001EDC1E36|nr:MULTISPECIES: PAS domain S-box protein [unclassified Niallia]MDL0434852.1 PAS domain S-box protein [Niallia sp. SS-2023]UPO89329.1 PAS domain S-box protein [Niallia sp. Man26]